MLLHWVETFLMLLMSLIGFLINTFSFYNLSSLGKPLSSFQKLCYAKALSNAIICSAVLFWAVPLSAASVTSVWRPLNIGIAQLTASGGYIFGPLCQICMAANRCILLFLPTWRMQLEKFPTTNIVLCCCLLASLGFSVIGMRGNCALIYHPDTLAWSPELASCLDSLDGLMLPLVLIITFLSIFLNFIAVLKLVYEKVSGISETQKARRRSRWLAMFIQNVIQDMLHVVDMINFTLVYKIFDAELFRFFFLSLSFALIYALDGLVMAYFHVYCKRKITVKTIIGMSPRQK